MLKYNIIIRTVVLIILFGALSGSWLQPPVIYAFSVDQVEERAVQLLETIRWYEFGMDRSPIFELQILITENDDPETQKRLEMLLLDFLHSDATPASRQMICKKLSLFATGDSVPLLGELLRVDETSDMARYVLERIPNADTAVETVLIDALKTSTGKTRIGIINSLGKRGGKRTLPLLEKSLRASQPDIVRAAIDALAEIADEQSETILRQALDDVKAVPKSAIWDAILQCADSRRLEGNFLEAKRIYETVFNTSDSEIIRIAALRGMVLSDPSNGAPLLMRLFETGEASLQEAAIGLIDKTNPMLTASAILLIFQTLQTRQQSQMLDMLAKTGNKAYLDVARQGLGSQFHIVRLAALRSLRALGDVSMVQPVAIVAAIGPRVEKLEAETTLARMTGEGVENKIIDLIAKAERDVRVVMIKAAAERNLYRAVPALLQAARDSLDIIRVTSIKALAELARPRDLPAMTKILLASQSASETTHAVDALSKAAMRIDNPAERSSAILTTYDGSGDAEDKMAVLRVLGNIGDPTSLSFIKAALKDANEEVQIAAIRALSEWPNAEVLDIVYKIALNMNQKRQQILAVRGYIDLIKRDQTTSASEKVKQLEAAFDLSTRHQEDRMILSALAELENLQAMKIAATHLTDPEVKTEAAMAVIQLAEKLQSDYPDQAESACRQILNHVDHTEIRKRAADLLGK